MSRAGSRVAAESRAGNRVATESRAGSRVAVEGHAGAGSREVVGHETVEGVPFIFRWCDKYGLSESTSAILLGLGFNTVPDLMAIESDDVKDMQLPMNQRLLLRGALLQFKQTDLKYAERRARKLGLPVEHALFLSKNASIELQYKPVATLESETPTSEEVAERAELRRRVRSRKPRQKGGVSLADRILNQRQDMLQTGSSVSLSSTSSGFSSISQTSANTLPAGHVTEPNEAKLRYVRSAADSYQRLTGNNNNNNDMDKQIQDILMVDTGPVVASRSPSRAASRASVSGSRLTLSTPLAVMDDSQPNSVTGLTSVSQPESVSPSQPKSVLMTHLESISVTQPRPISKSQPNSVSVSQLNSVSVSEPKSISVSQPTPVSDQLNMIPTPQRASPEKTAFGAKIAVGQKALSVTKSASRVRSPTSAQSISKPNIASSQKAMSGSASGRSVNNSKSENIVKKTERDRDPEDLVTQMDAALDRLLTEITESMPKDSTVRNAKGDLKAAIDIMDKDLVTDDDRSMVAAAQK